MKMKTNFMNQRISVHLDPDPKHFVKNVDRIPNRFRSLNWYRDREEIKLVASAGIASSNDREHVQREPISTKAMLYSRGQGSTKRTIVPEDIIYAEKGRVATALVAK